MMMMTITLVVITTMPTTTHALGCSGSIFGILRSRRRQLQSWEDARLVHALNNGYLIVGPEGELLTRVEAMQRGLLKDRANQWNWKKIVSRKKRHAFGS